MCLIVRFPGDVSADVALVGGKGHSLIKMSAAGLPIPSGAVLTTHFFAPWMDSIKATSTWRDLHEADPCDWPSLCATLQSHCKSLVVTSVQQQALADIPQGGLLAVRSSSPAEDHSSASFAGGYETRLGVWAMHLEDAVRACFSSCFDFRVFDYKQQQGFDVFDPQIAVIVQQQIDSEVAGVAFSLNPLTNDYDEAVINSNWGLGETVVAGTASVDHFVIDKVTGAAIERRLGQKQFATWLDAGGGTCRRESQRGTESTLSDDQLHELTSYVKRIEHLFEQPVDIEWTYAQDQLFILQARPITAYVPLPKEMLTKPGERRRLYTDAALSKGMAMNAPISPLGLDWIKEGFQQLLETFVAPDKVDVSVENSLVFFCAGSRMYSNFSNMMWCISPQRMASAGQVGDALMAAILANVDADRYRSEHRPFSMLGLMRTMPRILWRMRRSFLRMAWTILAPHRAHRKYLKRVSAYEAEMKSTFADRHSLTELRQMWAEKSTPMLFEETMPALSAGLLSVALVEKLIHKQYRAIADQPALDSASLTEQLRLGFTNNVVVEMGIALFRLAQLLDPSDFDDIDRLAQRLGRRELSAEFLTAWDEFIDKYGWRGPMEMDLASPRYADDPNLALRQISSMATEDDRFDPHLAHQKHVAARREAYRTLMRRSGWLRQFLLQRTHTLIELFAGTRDTPKHLNLMFSFAVRESAMELGRRLVAEGRLDEAQHVFDLEFADLERAELDESLDLRKRRQRRRQFFDKLKSLVRTFPPVIDSRGRILRPAARPLREGVLVGQAISRGIARGPVKVLQSPDDKPIEKGDVLVAYTTDPGWTPLFASAAAVVLEIGGVLQHGAVVAREYGKPCVAGIDRVTATLKDGQLVEVDGTRGRIVVLGD